MNTPVSFELAELLSKKEFDVDVRGRYSLTDYNVFKERRYYISHSAITENFIYAPTIAEVVMWMYNEHGIWIVVNFANKNQWYFDCNKIGFDGKDKKLFQSNYDFKSPTEAYKQAIEYCLNNLL